MIRERLARQNLPSVSVAVARGGRVIWEESFGWADRERRVRATPDTMYTLGSLAKPMTATAVMLLRERGLLDLDRPINDYLGDAKIVARVGDAAGATVRRVAQHTAGLPGYYETFYPDEPDKPPPMDEVIRRYGQIVFPPGERFNYSNLDYGILGHVVSRVSGKTYADFMRAEVFRPLGMTRSCVIDCAGLEKFRATRYFIDGSRLADYTTPHPAAADVYSSVHDLIRFGMFHLKAHLADQKRLLTDEAIDEMQRRTVAMGGPNLYGIGWVVGRDAKGRRRVGHGGAGAGVDTQLTLLPDERLAVAVLINTNIDQHISGEIADAVLNLILDGKVETQTPSAATGSQSTSAKDSGLPGKLIGTWRGFVHTYRRDLPVALWFDESGEVHAQLANQPRLLVSNARLENGTFTGRMLTGDIGTPDANRRPYYLDWNVVLRGDVLDGVLYAIGHNPSRGVFLGHWVELKRG
ncbi:MAG: beta-lactamase family protein [Acidobacteriota bacterium]|nr:beta-lactamase family protein [Acidobacteriota bacterium]